MSDLITSFYRSGGGSGTVQTFASHVTEIDVEAPEEGTTGFTRIVEHAIKHVFLNGVKLQYGVTNDYTVDENTNSLIMSNDWTVYTQDKILITS